jgi:osmotically-inducible protein OsmY
VRLEGKVRDVTHRALATRVCQALDGVRRVENNLQYVPAGTVQQTSATSEDAVPTPLDSSVRNASFQADANPFGEIEQIHFQKPGRRTESQPAQQVARPAQQMARPVQQMARPVQTAARPAQAPNNQHMAQSIANSLAQVGLVGYDVEIRYEDGIASLGGEVATYEQMQAAVSAASAVPGVQKVNNGLKVSGPIAQTAHTAMAPPVMPASMAHGMMNGMAPAGAPMAMASSGSYTNPHLPSHAWPAYAQYPNSAAITYPTQYSASAFPYIGPFYPYPQVPLGWREAKLEWDDGYWQLNFNQEKTAWYWLLRPKNW